METRKPMDILPETQRRKAKLEKQNSKLA